MNRIYSLVTLAILGVAAPALALPTVMIDSFTDTFEEEEFIFSAGSTIGSLGMSPGLEVGMLLLPVGPDHDDVGEPTPSWTERWQETQNQSGLAGVLGGARHGDLVATTDTLGSRVSVVTWGGMLSFSTGFGTQGIATLTYGRDADLNADFSVADGAFEFELISGDLDNGFNPRPIPATITVVTGKGTQSEATASVTKNLLAEDLYSFSFSEFAGVDFADVDTISLELDQSDPVTAAADFALGEFYALAPEPHALLLSGLGLSLLRRRA